MKFEEGKSAYPVGKLHELEATRETLPAIQVKNEVLYVNPDLDSPFKLLDKEGRLIKNTNLGMFLSSRIESEEKVTNLETAAHHGRSALLPRVIFGEKKKDKKERQLFRDIDIKGGGHVVYSSDISTWGYPLPHVGEIESTGFGDYWGILDVHDAQKNAGMAEMFHEMGIRTYRTVAIIGLEEIVYKGVKISITDAKAKGIIGDSTQPVLEVRAFGTDKRIIDACSSKVSRERSEVFIEDARLLIAQELGEDPATFNLFKYSMWLAKITGKNIGLMHKNGYVHGYFGKGHNITLDGCIVDLDSIKHSGSDTEFLKDYKDAEMDIKLLLEGMKLNPEESAEIIRAYQSSYMDNKQEVKTA